MKYSMNVILGELQRVVSESSEENFSDFLSLIQKDGTSVVCIGAGRVGLAMRGFTMRLNHLGVKAYFLGETVVPHTGPGDVLIVGSGSGSTSSILNVVRIAKEKGLKVALITATESSPMSIVADVKVVLATPNKLNGNDVTASVQPMTTLFEQSLGVFLDATVLNLMKEFNESSEDMWKRHNVIE
jgi:6-phospho-3-hexuloisomerase